MPVIDRQAGGRRSKVRDPRLTALDARIADARAEHAQSTARHEAEIEAANRASLAFSTAFRMSAEIVGGVVLGGLVGFGVDWVFSTSPWGLRIFVLLGFAAGVLNLLRQLQVRHDDSAGS